MVGPNASSFGFAKSLAAVAAAIAAVPAAHADVFEIGSNGQWQQINRTPVEPAALASVVDEFDTSHSDLPPVRLAAITTLGEPAEVQTVFAPKPRPIRRRYAPIVHAAANQYGISPSLVDAVMWQESRYNPDAVSSAGAIGLMQLMPGTARYLGVNPRDPWQNVFGGAAYLRMQLDKFGNVVPLALAAYNAGPGAVLKHRGIPPYRETQNYVNVIMRRLMHHGQ
jgi:soluble lytic murein transglycosylase-like protein